MKTWSKFIRRQKINQILSIFSNGEEFTATDIIQRLEEKGIVMDTTPQAIGSFIASFMEFKYLRRVRKPDQAWGRYTHRTFWRRL